MIVCDVQIIFIHHHHHHHLLLLLLHYHLLHYHLLHYLPSLPPTHTPTYIPFTTITMPAIALSNTIHQGLHQLVKRKNFAQKSVGVVVVFGIVGTVILCIVALVIHKKLAKAKARKNALQG